MNDIKFRLLKDGKVVGFEKAVLTNNTMVWAYRGVGEGDYHIHGVIFHDLKNRFTGLKDENGKEIYGGDVLEWADMKSNPLTPKTVVVRQMETGCWYPLTYARGFMWKVVGNIYENPEMMEVE